jgi:microcystin degradation protein MlrC
VHPSGHVDRRADEVLGGAMGAEHADDGGGELPRRIRAVAPRLPIAVGPDFHAQLTAALVGHATVTVATGYCAYPPVDTAETAARAGEVTPAMVWGSGPCSPARSRPRRRASR